MTTPAIAAIVLAAGRSTRMVHNKLMIELAGKPLVAHAADAAHAAGFSPVVVVTGHEAERVRAALAGRPVAWVHNPDYAEGMAGSLKAGIAALPPTTEAALVCLADMPGVGAAHMAEIAAAYDPAQGRSICVPVCQGKRGNPVLLGRRYFAEIGLLTGDRGARILLETHADQVWQVEMADDAIFADLDTAEAVAAFVGRTP